jgi:hypothetical protein
MESLPAELLLRVVEHVNRDECWKRPSKHLARLSQASQMLHRVSTPVLYAHIKQPSHIFGSLLRTLWRNPALRKHINKLQDMHLDENGREIPYDTTSGRPSDAELLIEVLSEELGMDPIDLLTRYNHGEHIWSAMCALLAPRLKHVAIVLHHELLIEPGLLLEHIARHYLVEPNRSMHVFQELLSLHLKPRSQVQQVDETYAFPLVLLPRLQALCLGGWNAQRRLFLPDADRGLVAGQPWTWPTRASQISELALRNIDLQVPVCAMIRACKELVKFESILCGLNTGDWYTCLAGALQEHRNTLREIYIGEGNNEDDELGEAARSERLHSLELMPCLSRLRIPWRTLHGHSASASLSETLPPNLEELIIELRCDPNQGIDAAFIRLYQHCVNKRFAALRDIHLLWRLNKTPFNIAFDVTKVRDLFSSTHIQFNVTVFCRDTLSMSRCHSDH